MKCLAVQHVNVSGGLAISDVTINVQNVAPLCGHRLGFPSLFVAFLSSVCEVSYRHCSKELESIPGECDAPPPESRSLCCKLRWTLSVVNLRRSELAGDTHRVK